MSDGGPRRKPRVFAPDDPDLEVAPDVRPSATEDIPRLEAPVVAAPRWHRFGLDDARRGFRWGSILLAAGGALTALAISLSFVRFVAIAFERSDWIGWMAFVLLMLVAVATFMLCAREIIGFWRLRRLGRIRADAQRALDRRDARLERQVVDALTGPLRGRADCAWPLARIAEHTRDVHDPGDLMRLVDRFLLMPLDTEARRVVAGAARRIGTVTAISPSALLTVGWVLVENLRLLRRLAGLYGGRPGFFGTARLARLVLAHIIATGGVALTDDLIGQFLGQDMLRRVSQRLGEGAFNAALTARIGAAAIDVIRPLPYLEAPPVRARDFISEILRRRDAKSPSPETGSPQRTTPA